MSAREQKVHQAAFVAYAGEESLEGPNVVEAYRPACGARPDYPRLAHTWDPEAAITCKRCLRMLGAQR